METETTLIENNAMHAILAASARSPDIPEAMDLYGFLIGSWELDLIGYDDDGKIMRTVGEAHFAITSRKSRVWRCRTRGHCS